MIDESSLPVGSCVKIANNSKMIMVAGFFPYDNQNKIMYDYIGIYTPIGIRNPRQEVILNKDVVCFNTSDIEKVIFIGYSDEKYDFYHKLITEMKDKIDFNSQELSKEMLRKIIEESLPKKIKSEV